MAVYTVHAPPLRASRASVQPEQFVFVRDGFSFPALVLGGLWMLRYRMWLVLLGYVVVAIALGLVLSRYGSPSVGLVVWALMALLIGFEAPTLRRFTLSRRGYRAVGLVVGDDLDIAERRFFDAWVKQETSGSAPFDPWMLKAAGGSAGARAPSSPSRSTHGPDHGADVLGLFPEPGAAT
jgi:hypothetical protein